MNTLRLSDLLPTGNHWDPDKKVKLFERLTQEYGFAMFPLCGIVDNHGTCGRDNEPLDKAGKHPMPRVSPLDATSKIKVLEAVAKDQPFGNFGIHAAKSNLLVIDVDPRNGGDIAWKQFCERFNLPDWVTAKVRTGLVQGTSDTFGEHIYFSYEGDEKFIDDLAPYGLSGVDIKRNGYVVAPSSMHKSGVVYDFKPGCAPWESGLLPLPDELRVLLLKTGDAKTSTIGTSPILPALSFGDLTKLEAKTTPYGSAALISETSRLAIAAEGTRNKTLFSVGARLSSLAAGGEINYQEMHTAVMTAAHAAGLEDSEIEAVLLRADGAYSRGALSPAKAPQTPASLIEWASAHSGENKPPTEAMKAFLDRANVQDMDYILGPHEPEHWIVPGVICEGRGHALLSTSGLGKSLLAREMAAKLACGEGFWGAQPGEPVRVLYLDYENDPVYDIGETLKSMNMAEPSAYKDNLTIMSYPVFGHFDTPEGAKDLEIAIDLFKPELVIIDTLSRVVEGEENNNNTWLNFYRSSGMVFKRKNVAYIRIDHVGKDATRGARGGSAKTGDLDLIWTLEQSGPDNSFKLTNTKSRVRIEDKVVHFDRQENPLAHVRKDKTQWDWPGLLKAASIYESAFEFMKEQYVEGNLKGQKVMWDTYKKVFEEMGISKRTMEGALADFKASLV